MTSAPTEKTWREKITLAAITGAASGALRATVTWIIDRVTSG